MTNKSSLASSSVWLKRPQSLALVGFLLASAGTAPAASLGLNFVDNSNGGVQDGASDALGGAEIAGVPGYAQANWNNLGRWGATVGLKDNTGAATGVTTTWDSNNTWQMGAGSGSGDNKLMHGYIDATGQANVNGSPYQFWWNENKPEVWLTGLTGWLSGQGAASYNVVVYSDGDANEGRIGEYWLQAASAGDPPTLLGSDLTSHVFLRDSANFSGAFTQVPLSADSLANAADGNYIVFTGLTADGFILRTEEQSFRAQINGLQIIGVVPEPGTMVLLGMGGLAVLLARRRR